jgi:nitrite reductase/ring-hydroxylating ferredoxin subunit
MSWHTTGIAPETLREGVPREILAGSRSVVLVRSGASVLAVEGACPHQGGLLSEGTVDGGRIACPVHGAAFDLATGEVRVDPFGVEPPEGGVERLATFRVRIERGGIEVELPDPGPR